MPSSSSSDVWTFYNKALKIDKDKYVTICKLCSKKFVQKNGSTTNLRTHLTTHHSREYLESKRERSTGATANTTDSTSAVSVSKKVSKKTKNKLSLFAIASTSDSSRSSPFTSTSSAADASSTLMVSQRSFNTPSLRSSGAQLVVPPPRHHCSWEGRGWSASDSVFNYY